MIQLQAKHNKNANLVLVFHGKSDENRKILIQIIEIQRQI